MLNQHTLEKLHALRLTGMAQALEQQRTQPQVEELGFEQRLGLLVDQEILYRDNRRLIRLLKAAKLRVDACVEDIDYRHPRGIDRAYLSTLITGEWIARQQNLCLLDRHRQDVACLCARQSGLPTGVVGTLLPIAAAV